MSVDKRKYMLFWLDSNGEKQNSLYTDDMDGIINRMSFLNDPLEEPRYWYEIVPSDHQHSIVDTVMCDVCGQEETYITVEHVRTMMDELRDEFEARLQEVAHPVTTPLQSLEEIIRLSR